MMRPSLKLFSAYLAITLVLSFLYVQKSWAGDQMNIDFLTRQALEKNVKLQQSNALLSDELYGESFSNHLSAGLDIVSEGIFGASFGIRNYKADLITGLAAMGVGITASLLSDLQESRSNRKIRKLLTQATQYRLQLGSEIRTLYFDLKNGSAKAREELVTLTNAESVSEIEMNIEMEAFFKEHYKADVQEIPTQQSSTSN